MNKLSSLDRCRAWVTVLAGAVLVSAPGLAQARMTFDDEFTSFAWSPDGSVGWMTSFPGENRSQWANHDAEWYSDASVGVNPFSLRNGVLSITAAPAGPGQAPDGLQFTSGIITSYGSFSQLYGLFEISAKLPPGQGLWPAFWLLPASNVYSAELDCFEMLGQSPATIYVSTHGETDGTWISDVQPVQTVDTSAGFHTYAVNWEPRTTTFYVDGKVIARQATPASMNTPMYMLINLAVGGQWSWPGPTDASTPLPAVMQIKWVRVFSNRFTQMIAGKRAIASSPR